MFPRFDESRRRCAPAGLTLVELMAAITILALVVGTLGVLSKGVQESYRYAEDYSAVTQHARVALERIAAAVREASANEQFPGAIVLADEEGSWRFPDTLVVWRPDGPPADADGLPRFNELVVFCPHPDAPNRLLEITVPGDTRTVPPVEDEARWITEIEAIKRSNSVRQVTLTGLVRTAETRRSLASESSSSSAESSRGAVRFEIRLRPSAVEWTDYQDGKLKWDELAWVQGIFGSQTGLRQVWVRTELQLVPAGAAEDDSTEAEPIPFFGSAALYYEMHR